MKLDPVLIRNLLQDIEKSNQTRAQFNLHRLVEEKKLTYGEQASQTRRSTQQKFDQIQRKTPQQYLALLDRFGVVPGEGLQREIRLSDQVGGSDSDREPDSGSGSGSGSDSDSDSDLSKSETKASTKKSIDTILNGKEDTTLPH